MGTEASKLEFEVSSSLQWTFIYLTVKGKKRTNISVLLTDEAQPETQVCFDCVLRPTV